MKTNCFFCNNYDGDLNHGRSISCKVRGTFEFAPHNCPDFSVNKKRLQYNLKCRVGQINKTIEDGIQEIQDCLSLLDLGEEFQSALIASKTIICEELSALQDALEGGGKC